MPSFKTETLHRLAVEKITTELASVLASVNLEDRDSINSAFVFYYLGALTYAPVSSAKHNLAILGNALANAKQTASRYQHRKSSLTGLI